jgi:hypothetical protein
VLVKSVYKSVSKSLKKLRLEMWFDGANKSFNAEFIWHNILVNIELQTNNIFRLTILRSFPA